METKDILVFIEQRDNVIQSVSYELLSEARKLVKQIKHVKFEVVGILLGSNLGQLPHDVLNHGADRVYVADHPELAHYSTLRYTHVISELVKQHKPDAFLIGASVIGRDLAPRIAARLDTGLTADATKIEINPNEENTSELWITRPAFGGNLFGTIVCPNHRPQMATIRPQVLDADFFQTNRPGIILNLPYKPMEDSVRILKRTKKHNTGPDITHANILVSGGRGMLNCFDLLDEVAQLTGGVVAASRGVVDKGAAPKDIQVGQTGKTVRPRLYLACGISGAVQHTAGMDKSETIIAINADPQAPIFGVATIGIVGDAKVILPLVIENLKAYKQKHQ